MTGYVVNAGAFDVPGLNVNMLWAVLADSEAEALTTIRASGALRPMNGDFAIVGTLSPERAASLGLTRSGQARPI